MKKPSILEGIGVAMALTFGAFLFKAIGFILLPPYLGIKFMVLIIAEVYILYLVTRRESVTGLLTLGGLSLLAMTAAFLLTYTLGIFTLVCIGVIWFCRSVLSYRSFVCVLLDGLLCVGGIGFALWIVGGTGSFIGALWCWLLVQAAYVFIPRDLGTLLKEHGREAVGENTNIAAFDRAYTIAEANLATIAKQTLKG